MEKYSHEIIPFKNNKNLAEISQVVDMQFAFVSDKYEQCTQLCKCRDFLHDAVRAKLTNTPMAIYGFNYEPEKFPPISLETMRMMVEVPDKWYVEEDVTTLDGLKLVNHYETLGNFKSKTAVYTLDITKKGKHYYLFEGPQEWLTSPALASLFTLLIRLGAKHLKFNTDEELQTAYTKLLGSAPAENDINYLKCTQKHLTTIVSRHKEIFTFKDGFDVNYFDTTIPLGTFHNSYGIVGTCSGQVKGITAEKLTNMLYTNKDGILKDKNPEGHMVIYKDPGVCDNAQVSGYSFALVSKNDKNLRYLATTGCSCRDYINDGMWHDANDKKIKTGQSIAVAKRTIDFSKLRLLVQIPKKSQYYTKEKIMLAKKMINICEKHAGFKKTTKIGTTELSYNTNCVGYLLTGPQEWMRAAQATSFITYIIKALLLHNLPADKIKNASKNIKTLDDIKTFFSGIADTNTIGNYGSGIYGGTSLKTFINKMDFVLKNFYKIFNQSLKEAFPANEASTHSIGGILSLMQLNTGENKDLATTLRELKKGEKDKKGD